MIGTFINGARGDGRPRSAAFMGKAYATYAHGSFCGSCPILVLRLPEME